MPDSNNNPGNNTVPNGSICLSGFIVTRPSRMAVSSPRRQAIQAWAASCSVIANRTGTTQIEISYSISASDLADQCIALSLHNGPIHRHWCRQTVQCQRKTLAADLAGWLQGVSHFLHGIQVAAAMQYQITPRLLA